MFPLHLVLLLPLLLLQRRPPPPPPRSLSQPGTHTPTAQQLAAANLADPPPPPLRTQLDKIPNDIIYDPTLQRDRGHECEKCHHKGAVFFQAKVSDGDTRLQLIFVCTNKACVHKWRHAV